MGYKTLIIVDNSSALTTLNQDIIKETIRYIIKNVSKEDSVAIAVSGENAEYLCEYDDSLETKLKTAEDIRFSDINASMTDVLMDVIINWKNDDLAMRDIIVISGSDITLNAEYTLEELFFEIGTKAYPIYTLTCSQDGNASAVKTLSSLSRISGAASYDVKDASDDADVEKQLGDKLLAAMSNLRSVKEKSESGNRAKDADKDEYEDEYTDEYDEYDEYEDETDEESIGRNTGEDVDTYLAEPGENETGKPVTEDVYSGRNDADILVERQQSNTIYRLPDRDRGMTRLIIPIVIVIIAAIVFYLFIKRKGNKERDEEEKYLRRTMPSNSGSIDISERLPFESIADMSDATMNLGSLSDDDEDTGTRLLYQSREGIEITLEDRANPTKYFRLCVRDSIVIGRNPKFCDVVIDYDDSVSSKHCEFYLRSDNVFVRDLNSSNGTMINQQKIYQEVKLESGDVLRIGRLSFFVQILGGING